MNARKGIQSSEVRRPTFSWLRARFDAQSESPWSQSNKADYCTDDSRHTDQTPFIPGECSHSVTTSRSSAVTGSARVITPFPFLQLTTPVSTIS